VTATYSDGTTETVGVVQDGADGSGTGDMSKATYDPNNHGYVDAAAGVTNGTVTLSFATLNGKADAATTLTGYGITDAYTKTEADNKFMDLPAAAVTSGKVATSDGSGGFYMGNTCIRCYNLCRSDRYGCLRSCIRLIHEI
jgi:hypothetical protein